MEETHPVLEGKVILGGSELILKIEKNPASILCCFLLSIELSVFLPVSSLSLV